MTGIYSGQKVTVVGQKQSAGQAADGSTLPSLAGTPQTLRLTGRSVNLEKNLLETEEIRSSRMQADVRHGFTTSSASLSYELCVPSVGTPGDANTEYGQLMLIESVLEGVTADAGITTLDTSGGTSTTALAFGDVVYEAGNAQVVYSAGTTQTSSISFSKVSDAAEINGAAYRAARYEIGNGATNAYVLERVFDRPTSSDDYVAEAFTNCVGNSLNISVSPESIATGTTEFVGTHSLGMESNGTLTSATQLDNPVAPNSTPVYAAFDGAIFEGGTTGAATELGIVTSVDFTVNNNRTTEARIGSKFADCVFDATAQVEGTMTVFFNGATQYNKFVDETPARLLVILRDPNDAGACMAISCPNIKYNGGTIDPPQEGPVTMEMPFRALEGDNGESAIKIVNVHY